MASSGQALPANPTESSIDQSLRWFWGFLKVELSPYPGRAWTVARITMPQLS